MKTKVADAIYFLFFLAIICSLAWLCSESSSVEARETECSSVAADALSAGRPVDDVLNEHALCIRGER